MVLQSLDRIQQKVYDHIKEKVKKHMKWDDQKADFWMRTPNPNLGFVAPIWMIYNGREHKLVKFVNGCIFEEKSSFDDKIT